MNIEKITGFVCMIVITILSMILVCAAPILLEINSNGIMKVTNKINYIDKCENDVKDILLNYIPEDKVETILDRIDVKTDIIGLINGFDSNKIEALATDIKEDIKTEVLLVLDDNSSDETKQEFASAVSDAYVSEIFPVSEFNLMSIYYNKYVSYIELAVLIVAIIVAILVLVLLFWKKNRNFLIISLYNIIIISVIIIVLLSSFDSVVIGSEKTTSIVLNLIKNISFDICMISALVFIASIIINYVFYFRKRKK